MDQLAREARTVPTGMTRGTTRRELARAVLECVAFQTRDLLEAMRAGLYPDITTFAATWTAERRFEFDMIEPDRAERYRGRQDAVARTVLRA